jgi:hypothetical protein
MTRADFYVGTGSNARYLGSVYVDGNKLPPSVKRARTPERFEKAVAKLIKKTNGSTTWPWAWETSATTDYSYWLENEKLYMTVLGVGKRVIEQKRGRPAAFERSWEMPVFTPVQAAPIHICETVEESLPTVEQVQECLNDPNLKTILS